MNRRTFLVGAGAASSASVAGCSGRIDGYSNRTSPKDSTPTETDTPEDLPRPYTKGPAHLLWAYWVQEVSPDIDPYPSDGSPVTDYDVVHTVFDDALDQGERESSDDTAKGESVFWEVSESTFYEIRYEFDDIEGNGDRPQYFEHDEEVIALKFDIPD